MKKQVFFIVLTALLIMSCANKRTRSVVGEFAIADYDGQTVYLEKWEKNQKEWILFDSTLVENRVFTFSQTTCEEPAIVFFSFDQKNKSEMFVAEPGKIKLSIDSTGLFKVSGTPLNNDYQQFVDQFNEIFEKTRSFHIQTREEVQSGLLDSKDAKSQCDAELELFENQLFDLFKSRVQNLVGRHLLVGYRSIYLRPEQIVELVSLIQPEFQSSEDIQKLKKRAEAQIASSIGKPFVDIHGKDLDGKEIFLSDYAGKGRVVLVDFWASWCGPCIRALPDLLATYQKFKNKGFIVIGCSLDAKMDAWKSATEKYQIPLS